MVRILESNALYYREQRNKLAYYLLENVGVNQATLAKILGVSRSAVNIQFPKRSNHD